MGQATLPPRTHLFARDERVLGMLAQGAQTKRPGARHQLNPGDVVCGTRGDRLETLLGSCVAVVLTDPRRTVGAMCHIVHTGHGRRGKVMTGAYGEVAFEQLFKLLRARGINPLQCDAYVYGGGNMFPSRISTSCIGERNARWVLHHLAYLGIRVVSHDLCGSAYRRLSWTVGTGAPHVVAMPAERALSAFPQNA